VVLEAEIGEFGTGLGRRQTQDADDQYEDNYGDDPGHTSRAELRFNAALRAAGGRGGRGRSARGSMKKTIAPAEWQAFPEDTAHGGKGKVTVIIEKEKPVAPPVRWVEGGPIAVQGSVSLVYQAVCRCQSRPALWYVGA
jgi:hypothetical protein